MSRLQSLKAFVNQRLNAAVEEIFGHFERTITEYEEELGHRFKPRDIQQLLVTDEEPPYEQQDPEPPHIKEERWSSQEGEQLQRMEEADITNFSLTTVKSEDDEEKPQPPELHPSQTEDNREKQPLTSSSAQDIETGADEEDCRGPQTDRNSHPDTQLEPVSDERTSPLFTAVMKISDDWTKTRANNPGLLENSECEQFSCSECGRECSQSSNLRTHVRIHMGDKPFSCLVCGQRFLQKVHLAHHMVHHTGEKLFSCTFCDESFIWLNQLRSHRCVGETFQQPEQNRETETSSLTQHMERGADGVDGGGPPTDRNSHPHTQLGPGTVVKASCFSASETEAYGGNSGVNHVKKPFSFSDCAKSFVHKTPVRCLAGEKPFSCLVCNKSFSWRRQLKRHMRIHTEDTNSSEQRKESFICTECGRRFVCKTYLKGHMRIHAGEMTNSCSVCGKCFVLRSHLNEHMRSHTGERPYSCQVCHKLFRYSGNLWRHMKIHSRETLLRGGGTNTQDQNQPGT
ncbi:Gastrula zinc finger protein XlCGF57.1 [Channa argus]|uniref:Gastrula zinc finger protein XlCGF57.1 n=1 Tax=Channa argus TaxID=215402 RepID=A0A6G1QWI7_CHAAH|nr:Gastrula zinc finger protein XlCGF57.1 [Channa argus]KAK2920549.1 hypothetical protein Q8A73_000034 [Channa argus]